MTGVTGMSKEGEEEVGGGEGEGKEGDVTIWANKQTNKRTTTRKDRATHPMEAGRRRI